VGDLRTKGRLPLRLKQVSRREDAVLFGHPFLNDRDDASCCPQSPELISLVGNRRADSVRPSVADQASA
jgi:hypothetical protein